MMTGRNRLLWQTTYMEYGGFYDNLKEEVNKKKVPRENEGRRAILTKHFIDCKSQLEVLCLRSSEVPQTEDIEGNPSPKPFEKTYLEAHKREIREVQAREAQSREAQSKEPKKHLKYGMGNMKAPLRMTEMKTSVSVPSEAGLSTNHESISDESNLEMMEQFSVEDTKLLESILRRLSEKLQPLQRTESPVRMETGKLNKTNAEENEYKPRCEYPPGCKNQMEYGLFSRDNLPPYCRYGFYKYYGYAGQGARTSWGHNFPLGLKPPYGKRTRVTFEES